MYLLKAKFGLLSKFVRVLLLFLFILKGSDSFSQSQKITYESSVLYTTEELGPKIKILIDSVKFFHENSIMQCDSALFNDSENIFHAFGNIVIQKPGDKDTVYLYGDTLHYFGDEKIAKIRNNVILEQDSLTLITDSLDYNLKEDLGLYKAGGITINKADTLESINGYYYANKKEFFFKDSVVLKNEKFTVYSDTLKHNTQTETSYFLGPTRIIGTKDDNKIYCENGWYNHRRNISQFNKNAKIRNKEKRLRGDSIFYDRNRGIGKAFRNVVISDTIQKSELRGNKGVYYENSGYSMMTDSALFIQDNEKDSVYVHADTLLVENDTLKLSDENKVFKKVSAYHKVKIFKSDFQAKCDSMLYSTKDSIIRMYIKPVMWSDSNQLMAEFIEILTEKREVKQVNLEGDAFVISQSDSIRFNQVKGKSMTGYIENRELYRIDVYAEGKSVYFAKDDQKRLVGFNRIECNDMIILLEKNQIEQIRYYDKPKGEMHPPLAVPIEQTKFPNFIWLENFRPLSVKELFIWEKQPAVKTEEPQNEKSEEKEDNDVVKKIGDENR